MPPARVRPTEKTRLPRHGADAPETEGAAQPTTDSSALASLVRPVWAGSKARRRTGELTVIGYVETVSLPGWGISGLFAKIDTGAETSALHVENLRRIGATRVAFDAVVDDDGEVFSVQARISRHGLVRSSNGHTEPRIFVTTSLSLGGRSQTVEIGLVDRSQMEYRMLVGRSALSGVFLVDPSRREE